MIVVAYPLFQVGGSLFLCCLAGPSADRWSDEARFCNPLIFKRFPILLSAFSDLGSLALQYGLFLSPKWSMLCAIIGSFASKRFLRVERLLFG